MNRKITHPRQIRWHFRMIAPIFGMKKKEPLRRTHACYGLCCNEYTRGGTLCTVCRKYTTRTFHCCGTHTVPVNPRIEVPRVGSNRWKVFLKKFPQFAFNNELICTKETCDDYV